MRLDKLSDERRMKAWKWIQENDPDMANHIKALSTFGKPDRIDYEILEKKNVEKN